MAEKALTPEDVLEEFVAHLHLSADALRAIIKGSKPVDHRRDEDTLMEFGFIPATNVTSGDSDNNMYLENSKIFAEQGPALTLEGT